MALLKLNLFLAIAVAVLAIFVAVQAVESHHQEYLPYAGETWLMRNIEQNQSYTYCLDSRAENYPGFSQQMTAQVAEYEKRTGIRAIKVAFTTTTACQMQHVMLPAFPCSAGAAACIYYASAPVVVHYKEELGFFSWNSATGHEISHGALGLHEQYIDFGSIRCDSSRTDTVMSCGTGVAQPQARDVLLGCALYGDWCGPEAPDPRGPRNVVAPNGATIHFGACNSFNQRWTSDIKVLGQGTWWPGGWNIPWSPSTREFLKVPGC